MYQVLSADEGLIVLTHLDLLIRLSVTLSDFYCVGVSGALQSIRASQDVMYFMKTLTAFRLRFPKCIIFRHASVSRTYPCK